MNRRRGVEEEQMGEQEGSRSHDGLIAHARETCLPRTPDCWNRSNPESFKQQVFGEYS
jgi:endonuclease III